METMKQRAEQYNDGLLAAQEFLGFCIEEIGKAYQGEMEAKPLANALAELLTKA